MALEVPGLKATIITKFNAVFGPPDDSSLLDKFAEAMAQALVEYLPAHNEVTVVVEVPGVMTGTDTATGSGTGTFD